MARFRSALNSLGFADKVISEDILPEWWAEEAADTPAGLAEAILYAARYSGIDYKMLHDLVTGSADEAK